ncbi:hypothetical protein KAW44_05280, partial [Candidatus Bipolaricaulota bacterium]|nr:hypothetical protein [Candidatus Bipolaricaulota bacterium]
LLCNFSDEDQRGTGLYYPSPEAIRNTHRIDASYIYMRERLLNREGNKLSQKNTGGKTSGRSRSVVEEG